MPDGFTYLWQGWHPFSHKGWSIYPPLTSPINTSANCLRVLWLCRTRMRYSIRKILVKILNISHARVIFIRLDFLLLFVLFNVSYVQQQWLDWYLICQWSKNSINKTFLILQAMEKTSTAPNIQYGGNFHMRQDALCRGFLCPVQLKPG